MKNFLDEFQEAWQSQCHRPLDLSPDQLLKTARLERRLYVWCDIGIVVFFSCCGAGMLGWAFRDIQTDWPWLIYSASMAWVVGYILFNRWRRQYDTAQYDEPLVAHVEEAIKDIKDRMRADANSLWWYVLPIALGCMIPPTVSLAMESGKRPLLDSLIPWLGTEGVFAVTFIFVHLLMKYGRRIGAEKQLQELRALQALRETLLNTENKSSE